MAGLYSYNKLFQDYQWSPTEELAELEIYVHMDDTVVMTVYEDYETSLEETWPDFIKDLYI